MGLAFDPQRQLDCPAVDQIVLNLNCRDEIIPILRSLQYVYQDTALHRTPRSDRQGRERHHQPQTGPTRPGLLVDHRVGFECAWGATSELLT